MDVTGWMDGLLIVTGWIDGRIKGWININSMC